jgi:hypothetical protein
MLMTSLALCEPCRVFVRNLATRCTGGTPLRQLHACVM